MLYVSSSNIDDMNGNVSGSKFVLLHRLVLQLTNMLLGAAVTLVPSRNRSWQIISKQYSENVTDTIYSVELLPFNKLTLYIN